MWQCMAGRLRPRGLDGRVLSEAMISANPDDSGLRSAESLLLQKPETKQSKRQSIFYRERGGNHFKSRASVQPFISIKATACLCE
jgi:hypothetical protein